MPPVRSALFRLATSKRWERAVRATSRGERWAWRAADRYVAGTSPAAAALPAGRRVQVGAEDHNRADAVLACVLEAGQRGLQDRLGATIQANFHRSTSDVERLIEAGVHIRLVKGAYVEPPSRALPYGEATDVAFLKLAHRLAATGVRWGTHSQRSRRRRSRCR